MCRHLHFPKLNNICHFSDHLTNLSMSSCKFGLSPISKLQCLKLYYNITEVAQRINQAKIAFWKKATILKSNISMKTRIRILMCYVFSVLSYGCETWTYSKAIDHKINAFEMWCYRRMLRISWTSHTTNIDVLQKIGVKETTMINTLKNRKLSYAGHIMRNTSGH